VIVQGMLAGLDSARPGGFPGTEFASLGPASHFSWAGGGEEEVEVAGSRRSSQGAPPILVLCLVVLISLV